jgi:two-component system, NtrC family, sensor kinase
MFDKTSNHKLSFFPRTIQQIGMNVLLAILYYGMAEISRNIASTPQSVTPVWPPDGLAEGAVLIWGNWLWVGVLFGSFLANIMAFKDDSSFLSLAISVLPVLGIALGTTLGTLLGAYLVRKFIKNDYILDRIVDVLKFLVLAGLIGPIINATVGVTSLTLSDKIPWSAYQSVWLTWWISNVSGIFIVAPILLSGHRWLNNYNFSSFKQIIINLKTKTSIKEKMLNLFLIIEPIFLLIIIGLVAQLIFNSTYHLEYVIVPLLIWVAFRLGQTGGTLAVFVVAGISAIATVNGKGGFARDDINQSLILLESFIAVITLTILVLTSAIAETKIVESQLKLAFVEIAKTNENLEIRVKDRTEELNEKNLILEETLNSLKRTQLQMIQNEKMSALGQMVGGIAHEINNPVNFIHGNLNYLLESEESLIKTLELYQEEYPNVSKSLQEVIDDLDLPFLSKDLVNVIESMKKGTERIKSIVLSLRNFSRLDEAELKQVDIHQGIDNTLVILQHRLNGEENSPSIEVIKEYDKLPMIECFAGEINQVFMNILNNAIDGIKEIKDNSSPSIFIQTKKLNEETVEVSIKDNGIGIKQENINKIFDPFFTTKPVGKGTGLGLSISYQIVTEKHGGKLSVESSLDQGTTFKIELPTKINS